MLAIFWFPALFYESLAHNARALGSDWLQAILIMQTGCQLKSGASDSATKMLVRLPSKKSGFEIVLMIKLAGLTNGRVILRQF